MTVPAAVLFDLDDTVWEYERDADAVLARAFPAAGVDAFFDAADWRDVMADVGGVDDQAAFRERCFAALARRASRPAADGRAVAAAYTRERDPANVRFRAGARAALDALAGSVRLGAVTNGGPGVQRAKLDALGLDDAFETVVFAGAGGPPKPDPDAFHRALDDLALPASDAVHVGDSLRSDVGGASAAGIRAVWVPRGGDGDADPGAHDPEHVVGSLAALPAALGVETAE